MGKLVHDYEAPAFGGTVISLGDEMRGERATLGKTLLDIQRDLRIKAAYIAAIEDAKPEVFPNPGFIAGYVRSYARYLGMDPDDAFRRFCRESGFAGKAGTAGLATKAVPGTKPVGKAAAGQAPGSFSPDFVITRGQGASLPPVPFAAIGSVMVLIGLIAGLGYGGWSVLQSIQRVQFAPVEDVPVVIAEVDPLSVPAQPAPTEPAYADLAQPVTATALADLYRQQEIEVPVLLPRDGPIASLDPDATGVLARPSASADQMAASAEVPAVMLDASATAGAASLVPAVAAATDGTVAAATTGVMLVAERAAWVRVYQENGTVLFESILEKGQSYSVPEGVQAPLVWAGNSGSVYVRMGEALYGPLGRGTRAAKDVSLAPQAITEKFPLVQEVPEVISQTMGDAAVLTQAVAIQ